MGGNVKVKYGLHEYQGQPISMPYINDETLHETKRLIGYIKSDIEQIGGGMSNAHYSGSVSLLMNGENIFNFIGVIGDIDLMMPIGSREHIHHYTLFESGGLLRDGVILGRKSIGNQDHLITFSRLGFVQVDIRYVPFIDGKPTEFSVFSHSAPWLDIRKGFKGSLHKVALAILARIRGYVFSVDYGLRKADAEKPYEYITDIDQIHEALIGHLPDLIERELFGSFVGLVELIDRYKSKDVKREFDYQMGQRLFGKDSLNISSLMKSKVVAHLNSVFDPPTGSGIEFSE